MAEQNELFDQLESQSGKMTVILQFPKHAPNVEEIKEIKDRTRKILDNELRQQLKHE